MVVHSLVRVYSHLSFLRLKRRKTVRVVIISGHLLSVFVTVQCFCFRFRPEMHTRVTLYLEYDREKLWVLGLGDLV